MDVAEFLQDIPLFSELSKQSIWRLADLVQHKEYKKNDLLIEQGKSGTGCFIITKGKVEVIKDLATHVPKKIAELGRGEIIGEMNVIDEQPHSASVRALTDTQCLLISYWDFKAQMQAYPEIALQLLPVIVRRLRNTERKE